MRLSLCYGCFREDCKLRENFENSNFLLFHCKNFKDRPKTEQKSTTMINCNTCKANKVCDHYKYGFENCGNYIPEDVVEVVRCKDCISYNHRYGECTLHGSHFGENGYCCRGKRNSSNSGGE